MKQIIFSLFSIFLIGNLNAATLIYNNGFETGNVSGLRGSGNWPTVATSPKASGKYSGNFTLTRSMRTPYRTEATMKDGSGHFEFGKEYWFSFDYRYEDWKKDKSLELAPFQIHTAASSWALDCTVWFPAKTAPFLMRSGNDEAIFYTYGKKVLWKGPIEKKKWLNIVVHFKISSGGDGFIEAWKDGVKLGKVTGPNSPKTDGCGKAMRAPYFKMGVYKKDWKKGRKTTDSNRRQLFIDNIKIAAGSNGYSVVSSTSKGKVQPTQNKPTQTSSKPKVTTKPKTSSTPKVITITGNKPKPKIKSPISNNKLFAFWDMQGSGRTIKDLSGNGRNGKLINGARIMGNGVRFGGRNDYMDAGRFNLSGKTMSISGWFNSENLKNCKHRDCRIISKASGVKENQHNWMVSTVSVGSKTRLRFRLKTNGKVHTLIASSGNLSNNKWIHFAAVYNGSAMFLFKDGKQVGNMRKSGNISQSKAPVWVGASPTKVSLRPFKGKISYIRLYNRALSKSEVIKLANES